ncbi:hypothetical protein HK101_010827 [Irineochytrium annulatum]|nr:hypothetical protein HK101_010827 [Irineochytrium annulatum]
MRWAMLIPVNVTGGKGLTGLDALTYANVADTDKARFWAPLVMLVIITLGVNYFIFQSIGVATQLRQHYLTSKDVVSSLAARTLMVRDVPESLRDPSRLQMLFDRIQPGSVRSVIVPRGVTRELISLWKKRQNTRNQLEAAVGSYISSAAKEAHLGTEVSEEHIPPNQSHDAGVDGINASRISGDPDRGWLVTGGTRTTGSEATLSHLADNKPYTEQEPTMDHPGAVQGAVASRPTKSAAGAPPAPTVGKRPVSKKFLCVGESKDKIRKLAETYDSVDDRMREIRESRGIVKTFNTRHQAATPAELEAGGPPPATVEDDRAAEPMPTAFVVFKDIMGPQVARSTLMYDAPASMGERYAGVDPDDVVWDNMQGNVLERQGRRSATLSVVTAMVIFWSIIIAAVSAAAQLGKLEALIPALKTVLDSSPAIAGIIAGILPTVVVAVVISLVPTFLRMLSRLSGVALKSRIERDVYGQFFFFQTFNILIIVTVASSVFTAIKSIIDSPASAVTTLASAMPNGSGFFINYVLLLGLSGPSGEILQLVPLIIKPILVKLLGTTPRAQRNARLPPGFTYATVMANHDFVAVVGLVYAVTAPLILIVVTLYFGFYYVVYMYQLQYVYVHPFETGGAFLYSSSKHLFTGLYIMLVIMIVLFSLSGAFYQLIIAVLLVVLTIWCSIQTARFENVINQLPIKTILDVEGNPVEDSSAVQKRIPFLARVLPGLERSVEAPGNVKNFGLKDVERSFTFPGPMELENYFAHPSANVTRNTVWLPKCNVDGVMETVAYDLKDLDVDITTRGAAVDEKGRVIVSEEAIAAKIE